MKLKLGKLCKNKYLPHGTKEIFVFILCLIFFAVRDIPILLYGGQILTFLGIAFMSKRMNRKYALAWLVFIGWAGLSLTWAANQSHGYRFLREIVQVGVLCVIISMYAIDEYRISRVVDFICSASILMVIYFLIKTPLSDWRTALYSTASVASSADRFGMTIGLHPNSFGNICAISCGCWLYQWRTEKKWYSIAAFGLILVLLLFTKSRASLLFFLLIVAFYFIAESRSNWKTVSRIALVAVGALFVLWQLLNNAFLYQLIGYRISSALAYVTNVGTVDASVTGRNLLLNAGREIIKDYPILGVGAGNYSNIAYESYGIWRDVYAHNNYIEIWADLGIIGLLIYYFPRFYSLFSLMKLRRIIVKTESKNPGEMELFALLLAVIVGILISDYPKITYSSEPVQMMFTLCFMYAATKRRRGVSSNYAK